MKRIIHKVMLLALALPLAGQIDESKIPRPTEPRAMAQAIPGKVLPVDCCSCPGNILQDGGFEKVTTQPNSSNISGSSTPWRANGSTTPQWNPAMGLCNKGYIQMWGNKVVGESVVGQTIAAGKYQGKFVARFMGPTQNSTHVNLEIRVGNTTVYTSPNISETNWKCIQIPPFQIPAGALILLRPTNQHSANDPNFISWIQIDSICLEKVPDCNCDALAKEIKIQGPTEFCKPVKCDSTLSFSAPKLDAKCFTYAWSVSPEVKFEGQGTAAIGIPCKALKTGKYEFKLSITCNGKSVSTGHVLNVCDKPDPAFNFNSNGNSVTLSSSVAGNHSWYLVADANNNCTVDNNETPVSPGVQTGNSVSYAGLVSGQQYVVMHYVDSQCGKRCVSLKSMCFKFMPSQMKQAPGSAPVAEKSITVISDKEVESEIIESAMRGWPLPKVDTRPRPPIKK